MDFHAKNHGFQPKSMVFADRLLWLLSFKLQILVFQNFSFWTPNHGFPGIVYSIDSLSRPFDLHFIFVYPIDFFQDHLTQFYHCKTTVFSMVFNCGRSQGLKLAKNHGFGLKTAWLSVWFSIVKEAKV